MKEIQQHTPDKIINVRSQEQESQQKRIGRLVPAKGHTLWEINMRDETISKAEFSTSIDLFLNSIFPSNGIDSISFLLIIFYYIFYNTLIHLFFVLQYT